MGFSYSVNVDGRVTNSIGELARLMPDETCESVTVTCEAMDSREYALVKGVEEAYEDYLGRAYEFWLEDAYARMDTEPWRNASIEYLIVVETFGKTANASRDYYVRIEKPSDSKLVTYFVDEQVADEIFVEVYGTFQADVDDSVAPMIAYLEDWMDPVNPPSGTL